jgi:hypothetical protein
MPCFDETAGAVAVRASGNSAATSCAHCIRTLQTSQCDERDRPQRSILVGRLTAESGKEPTAYLWKATGDLTLALPSSWTPVLHREGPLAVRRQVLRAFEEGTVQPESMETVALVKDTMDSVVRLLAQQIALLKLEAEQQLAQERRMLVMVGLAMFLGLAGVLLLLLSLTFAVGVALDGRHWAGALLVAVPLLVAAVTLGVLGWRRRIRQVLPRTASHLEKEMQWARTRLS